MLTALAVSAAMSAQSLAAYEFESGADTMNGFGYATTYEQTVLPNPLTENVRRSKDNSALPPPYGIFGGSIDTDTASPLYDNTRESGFVLSGQQLPPNGGGDYAPNINAVSIGWTQLASAQPAAPQTAPLYNDDGTIGTLYVERTKQ